MRYVDHGSFSRAILVANGQVLFKAVESRLGQANVLKARGDLRRYRDDLEGAGRDG